MKYKYIIHFIIIAEHVHNILKSTYKNLVLSKLNCTSNVEYVNAESTSAPIILGRSYVLENGYNTQDYKGFFLGAEGKALAILAMGISVKKWYCCANNKISEFDVLDTPWLKRRRYLLEKLKDAKVVGIVVATLGIKEYLKAVTAVKRILKEKDKKSYILSVGKINPVKLANFPEVC